MSYLISIAIGIVLNALVLALLPFVRYKNFSACLQVSALTALISTLTVPLEFVVVKIAGFFLMFVPILGPLAMLAGVIMLGAVLSVAALFAADQIVEDFEISTVSQTVLAAFILSIASGVAKFFVGF